MINDNGLINLYFIVIATGKTYGWIRLGRYGPGTAWRNAKTTTPKFSERMGYEKSIQLFGYSFRYLKGY